MSRRCPFCRRFMDCISGGGVAIDTYECPTCGCQWCFGLHKLPDPDRLRREAAELEAIADEIDSGDGLAARLQGALA